MYLAFFTCYIKNISNINKNQVDANKLQIGDYKNDICKFKNVIYIQCKIKFNNEINFFYKNYRK